MLVLAVPINALTAELVRAKDTVGGNVLCTVEDKESGKKREREREKSMTERDYDTTGTQGLEGLIMVGEQRRSW